MYQKYKHVSIITYDTNIVIALFVCRHHLIYYNYVCFLMPVSHVISVGVNSHHHFMWDVIITSDNKSIIAELLLEVDWQSLTYDIYPLDSVVSDGEIGRL